MIEDQSAQIEAAQSGDKAALGELLYELTDELTGYIRKRIPLPLQSFVDFDDILQETFACAFRDIGTFENRADANFAGWLKTIAKSRIQDSIRRQMCKKRGGNLARVEGLTHASVANLMAALEGGSSTPLRRASRQEVFNIMDVALAELRDEYRLVIQLQYFEGLSHAEIANRMKKSPAAVHGLLKRAKSSLRDALGRASAYLSTKS